MNYRHDSKAFSYTFPLISHNHPDIYKQQPKPAL